MKKNSEQTEIFCNLQQKKDNEFHLKTWGVGQNITSTFEALEGVFSSIPDRFMDFLDIATFVYCGDQVIARSQDINDKFGHKWHRGLHFHIGVRDIDFWQTSSVIQKLEEVLSFLSGECISFEFYMLPEDRARYNYLDFVGKWEYEEKPNQVMLFSGGLDSLGGVIQEALDNCNRLVLVRHRPTNKFNSMLKTLDAQIESKAPYKPLFLNLKINKHNLSAKEYTQRTRSFLYFSLAATAAYLLGTDNVRFYENGPVSINLPMLDQVIGSQSTRTTHPKVLFGFQEIASMIAERKFKVENPFILKTKSEVIATIINRGCGDMIANSISCAHSNFGNRSLAKPQCGACSQCIDRRFAFAAKGWSQYDPVENYSMDFFTGGIYQAIKNEVDQATLIGYVARAIKISEMNFNEFILTYPQISRVAKYSKPNASAAAQAFFDLYKRQSKEVMDVCLEHIDKNKVNYMLGSLPSDSLARLVVDNASYISKKDEPIPLPPYLERVKERDIEIWKINGEAKDLGYKSNSKQHIILMLLYSYYISGPNEWMPHKALIPATGWKEQSYFGAGNGENGLMHKRLFELRKALGINIEFDKEKGCRILAPGKS